MGHKKNSVRAFLDPVQIGQDQRSRYEGLEEASASRRTNRGSGLRLLRQKDLPLHCHTSSITPPPPVDGVAIHPGDVSDVTQHLQPRSVPNECALR